MPAHSTQAQQTQQAQQQAFSIATNISKQIGPKVVAAVSDINAALPQAIQGRDALRGARDKLRDIQGTLRVASALAGILGTGGAAVFNLAVARPKDLVDRAERLVTAYEADVTDIVAIISRGILPKLERKTLIFDPSSAYFKHTVNSCSDLRKFSVDSDNLPDDLKRLGWDLLGLRRKLDFYGTTEGKRQRNQTTQLMTDAKLYVNSLTSALTSIMRSGGTVRSIRRWIDRLNDNSGSDMCSYPRRGSSGTYSRCWGLNAAEGLLKYTAAKQGLSWNTYRDKWMGSGRYFRNGRRNPLSDSDKERNIVTALDEIRSLLAGVRDRTIPNARALFISTFAGMGDVIAKGTASFTASQRRAFGVLPQGYLELVDAYLSVTNAKNQATAMAPAFVFVNNPANVQCQSGSGYAGIFGGDADGEPMNPMLVVGGGLVAGLAVAHFFPNLLRR